MTVSPPQAVNHHADRPGFAGLTGLLAAGVMLVAGRSRAPWSSSLHRCPTRTASSTSVAGQAVRSGRPHVAGPR
jgi:hypothetical protein